MRKVRIRRVSLRIRIFLSMILLTLLASILMASISIIQFRKEAREYHQERLERKENAIKAHINYILSTTTYPLTEANLSLIFKDRVHELADIHSTQIRIYSLKGRLVSTSKGSFSIDSIEPPISEDVLRAISASPDKRYAAPDAVSAEGKKYRSSYSQIKDLKFKPLGILNLPYIEDDGYYDQELKNFLVTLGQVYSVMLVVAFILAYILSSFITKSLKSISAKIMITGLNQKNEKLDAGDSTREISLLVNAYNDMVDKLEESASKLAQGEREQAWREMARQVAHEIKNPLTPMRLTVQSFQRKFDPNDPDIRQKLDDYSRTLINQIDTMSAVASAFSNFASMPAQQNETLNVVENVDLALDIFNEEYVHFQAEEARIIIRMDRTQLIRVITNLVKNAIQAIPDEQEHKSVVVTVKRDGDYVLICVADNGRGIAEEHRERIFEPKFTTKSSGMGLGLGIIHNIIENYKGTITFDTEVGKGTVFTVSLPLAKTL